MIISDTVIKIEADENALSGVWTAADKNFIKSGTPFWSVTFIDRQKNKQEFHASATLFDQEKSQDNQLVWTLELTPEHAAQVIVSGKPAADPGLTLWQIKIASVPANWSVFKVVFPCFDWHVDDSEQYKMVIPTDRGIQKVNPLVNLPDKSELWVRRKFRERSYPNGFATMQVFGLIDGEDFLYFAAHDPVPAVKNFYFEPDVDEQVIRMRPCVKTALRYGAEYTSFDWAIGVGKGDWFDIATIYRQFALSASWTREGALEDCEKTPRWYQDTPIVLLKDYRGDLYDVEAFTRVAKFMNVPMLLHYYMWHMSAFDADYPFFFPATPNFREDMKKLQQVNIRVMPYINGYSADTSTPEWQYLKNSAIRKNENQEMHSQVWSQNLELAAICPSDKLWQRILNLTSMRCVEMGVDGIYFDEVACSPAHNCYAENHDHIPGDEYAFISGHRKIMKQLRDEGRAINPELILTTESCSEAYMDVLDGFLIGNGNASDEVPLFEAVYHDYTIGFGQYMYCEELYEPKYQDALIGKCARQFIFGSQFAWSRIPLDALIEADPRTAGFIKTLAHTKIHHSDYLTRGKMLRPLPLGEAQGNLAITQIWQKSWNDKVGEAVELMAVMNSVWIKNNTSIGVVLVNITDTEQTVEIDMLAHAKYYPLPQPGIVRLFEHRGEHVKSLIAKGSSDKFEVTLPPLGCVVATIGSEKPYGVHHR